MEQKIDRLVESTVAGRFYLEINVFDGAISSIANVLKTWPKGKVKKEVQLLI